MRVEVLDHWQHLGGMIGHGYSPISSNSSDLADVLADANRNARRSFESPSDPKFASTQTRLAQLIANSSQICTFAPLILLLYPWLVSFTLNHAMMAQESSDHSRTSSDLFDSLCSEVLGEIFVTCTLRDKLYDGYAAPSLSSAPINVSQVCRRWRQVALSTPRLWSTFLLKCDYNVNGDASDNVRCIVPVIATWIKRSSSAPLEFEVYVRLDESAKETAEVFESLLGILIDQRERWRSASINYDFPHSRWFDVTFSNMLMLQELQLVSGSALDCVAHLDFSQSPELRSLSLEGNIKIVDRSVIPSLTNISITSNIYRVFDTAVSMQYAFPTFHDCFNILRMAPSLQTLFAKFVGSSERGTFEHIKMDKLRWIRLQLGSTQATSKHHLSAFFDHLTLPSLSSLQLDCDPLVDYCPITPSMLGSIYRSKASISHLSLNGSAFEEEHLVSLLRLLPELTSLSLCGMRTLDTVLSSLTLTGVNDFKDDFCPRLEYITLQNIEVMSASLFSDCIISRWRKPRKSKKYPKGIRRSLTRVDAFRCISYDEVPKDVRDLKFEGLKLIIR